MTGGRARGSVRGTAVHNAAAAGGAPGGAAAEGGVPGDGRAAPAGATGAAGAPTAATTPARLSWIVGDLLPDDVRAALIGPGAPHELVVEAVQGRPHSVFARRPANLRALLDETGMTQPEATFLVDGDRRWTFAEAAAEIDALAGLLHDRYGIGKGDRVAIVSANSPEYGLLMWATVSIGAVVSSLNGWWTGAELRYGIELSTPALIAGDERRLARVAEVDVPSEVPVVGLTDLLAEARAAAHARPAVDVEEDDPAVILFTSGTTGRPKGATLSHRNIVNFASVNRLNAAIGAAFAPPDAPVPQFPPASILSSPMFHVSGMLGILLTGPVFGTTLVFPPPGKWDPGRHLELTEDHRVSTWSGVPTQFWRLLRHPDFPERDLRSLRNIGAGGSPFPPELTRALKEALPWVNLGNGYGMSETVGLGTLNGGQGMLAAPDSVGLAQPGTTVEVRDPMGRPLPEGEVGEIHLRNASVFLGYWDDADATAAVLDDDRWYRTGDFGRLQGGMLYLESRMRDMILRGGENIYPIEIENRLVEHPDIDDAAVVGIDHEELGQDVKAFVVPRPGSDLTAAEVQRWAGETLARYKIPTHVAFLDALPYNDAGKVLKHQLEAR
jgi:acyl-CoA synthetase (AMP-forming)/AMP-acid ligase II